MTGAMRFVCGDPDAGDLEFADAESVLDALEATLITPATPLFDAARQSLQPVGMHPEIRAAWESRLRYRPPAATGLGLPDLPSLTALARSLPSEDDAGEQARRREAYARVRASAPTIVGTRGARDDPPRFAVLGVVWALVLLVLVGWVVIAFAAKLIDLAARVAGIRPAP
jgi:hypothetical protein